MDEKNMHEPPKPEGLGGPEEHAAAGSPPVIGGPEEHTAAGSPPVIGGIPGGRPPGVTGDERVDDAVAGLSRLPGRPVDEHVAVLEEVHGRLRDILGELNEGPGRTDQDESPP
jgi:hypothetical protein